MAHIGAVASGLACACKCPACGRTLIAKKGRRTAAHFSHHGNASGCGNNAETNAHIWAKDVLNREKRILLPAVRASVGKEVLQTYGERVFQFEHAELEKGLGDIVPDVILTTKDGRQVLIEVMVTHACGPEKIAKLRDRGLATLEIDLSRWRKSSDRHEIEQALMKGAPREWLFNRKADEAQARLATTIAERAAGAAKKAIEAKARAEAADKLREAQAQRRREDEADLIVQLVEGIQKGDAASGDHDAIARRGLLGLLVEDQNAMGFTVVNEHWQAAIIERMIEVPVDEFELPEFDVSSVLRSIDDCIAPDMPEGLALDVRAALPLELRSLDLPKNAVQSFLDHLCDHDMLRSGRRGMFMLPEARIAAVEKANAAWQIKDRRRRSSKASIDVIVDAIPVEEHGEFSLASWWTAPVPGFDLTLEELIESDQSTWEPFETALSAIRGMVEGGTWVRQTLGLPLQGELGRAGHRVAQQKEREAEEREASITRSATALLGTDGPAWATTPGAAGSTPTQLARDGAAGLTEALRVLDLHHFALAAAAAADTLATGYRQQLLADAEKGLDQATAKSFMTYHDVALGMSPWAICRDAAGLRRARIELAKWVGRERKKHNRR
ncbi:hypothetical protein EQZ23_06915 [Sphingomonas sp. UV9]|uniref:hypothetical protein n=1 Tax=Sphingomonas sp. UV9 TaxID=1851410 RepID=UPI000FFC6C6C|nr:hypothetical protein [Sphingomonas sp. UV9]RXD04866.1 hypothetical protein EQZ23_06915 [Sphingomonas sp. UV9]